MALTHEDLEILKRRFEVDEHEFHRGNVYLRENAITDRIELVDPSWTADVIQLDRRTTADGKLMVVILMRVTISGVFRDGIGQAEVVMTSKGGEANEPEKSAATDALKRAVRLFGVGRYLLDVPKEVSDYAGLRAHFNGSKKQGSNVPESKGKLSDRNKTTARPTFADNPKFLTAMTQYAASEGLDDFGLLEALNLANLDALKALPCDDDGRAEIKTRIARFKANSRNRDNNGIREHVDNDGMREVWQP